MHALRIKGFAKVDVLAELSATARDDVETHLVELQDGGHAMFREARALWQLTPDGRDEHAERLAADVEASGASEQLASPYGEFLELNERFKALCGDWQLRNGDPNDHADSSYDGEVDRPARQARRRGPAGRRRARRRAVDACSRTRRAWKRCASASPAVKRICSPV